MIICSNCGSQEQEGTQFCRSCGTAVGENPTQNNQQPPMNNNQQVPPQNNQPPPQSNDAEANKGMAIIAYIIFFIPLLTGDYKKSPFVKYHTNQGTILFIVSVALNVAVSIVRGILRTLFWNWFAWPVYGLFNTALNVIMWAPMILLIIGIINAVNGATKPLPVVGDKFTIIK